MDPLLRTPLPLRKTWSWKLKFVSLHIKEPYNSCNGGESQVRSLLCLGCTSRQLPVTHQSVAILHPTDIMHAVIAMT